MAQLSRIIQRIFGQTGTVGDFGQIGSQAAGTPITTKDLTTMQALPQYLDGLTAVAANQGGVVLPYLEDINSLLLLLTSQVAYVMQNGIPEWLNDVDQRYYADVSFVTRNGIVYQAILGDDSTNINAQRDPATETSWWRIAVNPGVDTGFVVGDVSMRMGNAVAPSAAFPRFCMTNFTDPTALSTTNWPLLVPYLRDQTAVYLEGLTGEVSAFPGTVAASVITLDDTTANNAILAALDEDRLANGGSFTDWRTVDIDGTTYVITALDTGTRAITVTGTPTVGAQNATFYPHRIAGSTTTARLHSWVGRSPIGAGTAESVSGLLRRDRVQGWQIGSTFSATDYYGEIIEDVGSIFVNAGSGSGRPSYRNASQGSSARLTAFNDGTNGQPRLGADTHGPDSSLHMYVYGGSYSA